VVSNAVEVVTRGCGTHSAGPPSMQTCPSCAFSACALRVWFSDSVKSLITLWFVILQRIFRFVWHLISMLAQ